MGQFGSERGRAEREYRQFVRLGIGQKTIWSEVCGQMVLGEDDFVDKMTEHIKKLVVPSGMHRRKMAQMIYRNLIGVGLCGGHHCRH